MTSLFVIPGMPPDLIRGQARNDKIPGFIQFCKVLQLCFFEPVRPMVFDDCPQDVINMVFHVVAVQRRVHAEDFGRSELWRVI